MNSLEFLKIELEKISKLFPSIYIKYGFNKLITTHIVELLPLSEYLKNQSLAEAWMPLSFEFREQFPLEEIAFVSSDSTLCLENSVLEFNIPSMGVDISTVYAIPLSENDLNYTFPETMPVGAIAIGTSIVEVLKCPKQKIDPKLDLNSYYHIAA